MTNSHFVAKLPHMSKIVVSGIKPTGTIHIGNYFGMMKQIIDLQHSSESRIFVADLHALTSVNDSKKLRRQTLDIVKSYIAAGLDPKKAIIFKQSDIREIAELSWIFNCLTTMPQLMRAHAFKDAEAKNKEINVGVFDYPILMAADILIHNANVVPVGKDQKQHVEIAREVARKFNQTFGDTFVEPQEKIIEGSDVILGTDGQKMSKSYNNTLPLFASRDEIRDVVMKIPTDSASLADPKDTNSTLFKIHSLFITDKQRKDLEEIYNRGGLGYKDAKEMCIEAIDSYISPMRDRFNQISDREVIKILERGGKKINKMIEENIKNYRDKVGISLK